MFTENFSRSYVCPDESISCEVDGFKITATIHNDNDSEAPWDHSDGHGPVSEWTSRDKAPGERVLCSDRHSKRFYDFAKAVAMAKRDGWGDGVTTLAAPRGERAANAAEADFRALKAWCDDEWFYCGIVLTVEREGLDLDRTSLWGIEANYPGSDNSYLRDVANELLDEALDAARKRLAEIAGVVERAIA